MPANFAKTMVSKVNAKRCPYCNTNLPVKAAKCFFCNKKVGKKIDEHGKAIKPVDLRGYFTCFAAWITLIIYIWFMFFRKP